MDKRKIAGYVKHNQFDREQRNKETDWFKSENLEHDKKKDIVYCPIGEPMPTIGTYTRITTNGFKQTLTNYQATKCKGCPVRDVCHSQRGNRIVAINHRLRKLKERANVRLKTEQGIKFRKRRPADIEPVFANIKHNKNFKRFMLKGIKKVEIETGLLVIAHNLGKLAA